jgi:hypothetical protein
MDMHGIVAHASAVAASEQLYPCTTGQARSHWLFHASTYAVHSPDVVGARQAARAPGSISQLSPSGGFAVESDGGAGGGGWPGLPAAGAIPGGGVTSGSHGPPPSEGHRKATYVFSRMSMLQSAPTKRASQMHFFFSASHEPFALQGGDPGH